MDALYFSSEMKREVLLSYYEENATFLISGRDCQVLQAHPVYEKLDEYIRSDRELMLEIIFSAIGPRAGVDGGPTEFEEDDLMLSSVRFHAGCSTPFMAEIKFRGEVEEVEFDPFPGMYLQRRNDEEKEKRFYADRGFDRLVPLWTISSVLG